MSSNTYDINYTKCVVIVHGKSEYILVRYITTNLHLPIKIIFKNKGSIQIGGLLNYMKKDCFKSILSFSREYNIEYDKKSKELKNFKLYIIMDTDDCKEREKENYINSTMFNGHLLRKYICPIYNINNLEDVMIKAGIMTKRISNSEKGTYYTKVFPINKEGITIDTVKQVTLLRDKLKNISNTNLTSFIDYCLKQIDN